jgi:hypothetical protein
MLLLPTPVLPVKILSGKVVIWCQWPLSISDFKQLFPPLWWFVYSQENLSTTGQWLHHLVSWVSLSAQPRVPKTLQVVFTSRASPSWSSVGPLQRVQHLPPGI